MKIFVRPMVIEDMPSVLIVEHESFPIPWSREAFHKEIEENHLARYYVVVDEENHLYGYGGIWLIGPEGHITNIAIAKKARRKGLGHLLVSEMIKCCEQEGIEAFTLEARVSNLPAINLYKKHGFKEAGLRKGYYTDTKEDALIMWRQ